MGLLTLPTLTDDSLGRTKVDRAPAPNKDEYVTAAEHNEIKARVAELATCIGLRNGTTPDSIEERLASAGGGIDVGGLLFAWNGSDTSQFESTAHVFDGGGSPVPGELALSVVNEATHGVPGAGNVLQVDLTAMPSGGGMFAVLTSELTLPSRYVVVLQFLDATNPNPPNALCALAYREVSGTAEDGFYIERPRGSSSVQIRSIVNGADGNAGTMQSGGSWDDAVRDLGGVFQTNTVFNQTGATPSACRVLCRESVPDFSDEPAFDGQLPHLISGVGTNWDGLSFDRIGIGMRYGGGGTINGFVRIADFRVFAHPRD